MKTSLILVAVFTAFAFSGINSSDVASKSTAISQITRAPKAVTDAWEAYKLGLQSEGYTSIAVYRFGNKRLNGQQVFYYLFNYIDPATNTVHTGSVYFDKNGGIVESNP